MSHEKERQEKNCLNCGTLVHGKFCHTCGQKNIEIRENFWHLTSHLVADIFHYDSKFFTTLKYLIFKPGFLTKEYLKGKRASYLHPIKMYVFTSAVFFILFFTFFQHTSNENLEDTIEINGVKVRDINKMPADEFAKFTAHINKENHKDSVPMTREEFNTFLDSTLNPKNKISLTKVKYESLEEYDSLVQKGIVKDNWLERKIERKGLVIRKKYHNDRKEIFKAMSEKFLHLIPQMLFVSLPIFALILKLLYIRRKQYYYVSHTIFSLHLYCATFLLILTSLITKSIWKGIGFGKSYWVTAIFFFLVLFYGYKAMRNFYEQKRLKTISKYTVLLFLQFFFMLIIFIAFFIISVFTI